MFYTVLRSSDVITVTVTVTQTLFSDWLIAFPPQDLMDPVHWSDICEVFTKEACSLMGLSKESPLSITVDAGCKALPALNSTILSDRLVT